MLLFTTYVTKIFAFLILFEQIFQSFSLHVLTGKLSSGENGTELVAIKESVLICARTVQCSPT